MKNERVEAADFKLWEDIAPIDGIRIGRIVRINENGSVLVDFPGNRLGPLVARTTTSAKAETVRMGDPKGREVLLVFENRNPQLPIIVDTIYSLIDEIAATDATVLEAAEPQDATVDGKRITFEAEHEIVLRCGKSSITLTRAGKVLIKGEYVLSHSSGENRIRGASTSIN